MNNSSSRVNHRMINNIIKQVLESREDIPLNKISYSDTVRKIKKILLKNSCFNEIFTKSFNPISLDFKRNGEPFTCYKSSFNNHIGNNNVLSETPQKINSSFIEDLISILALIHYSIDYYFHLINK